MSDQMSKYLNYQFSGKYNQAIAKGIEDSFKATNDLLNYLINLNIDNALEKECECIGLWIGFPRPYIPEEFLIDNAFLFFKIADGEVYSPAHGFSSLSNPLTGGRFISLDQTQTKLPLDIYKALLKKVAYIKYNGWNFLTLDYLCQSAGINYDFSFDSEGDVIVTYESEIHPIYVYIFEIIFNLFMTLPRVTIIQGE